MKEVKTLWEVEYSVWGADKTRKRYFESKEDAEEWAKEDYRDNPVKNPIPVKVIGRTFCNGRTDPVINAL